MARINGTAGNDSLQGDGEDDRIQGGLGDDILRGDIIVGGAETQSDDTLIGGGGADQLFGGPGNDVAQGGKGADLLSFGDGADTVSGGQGDDRLAWSLTAAAEAPRQRDTATGGSGQDTLLFGVFPLNFATLDMRGDLGSGATFFLDGRQIGTVAEVEALQVNTTSLGTATLIGGAGDDEIRLNQGVVDITTGSGDDFVQVQAALPGSIVRMGTGDDTIQIQASANQQKVRFDLKTGGVVQVGGSDVLEVRGAETVFITGSNKSDRLLGASGDDTMRGGVGKDILNGRGGDDDFQVTLDGLRTTVKGGAGTDILRLNAGNLDEGFDMSGTSGTTVVVGLNSGADALRGTALEALDVFGSRQDDLIVGLRGDDNLFGGLGGDDTLRGNQGADTLEASSPDGQSVLVGGGGADTFVLGFGGGTGSVTARDFSADDSLSLSNFFINSFDAFDFVKGRAPEVSSDVPTFLYNTRSGELIRDSDGIGTFDPGRVVMILLNNGSAADLSLDQFALA